MGQGWYREPTPAWKLKTLLWTSGARWMSNPIAMKRIETTRGATAAERPLVVVHHLRAVLATAKGLCVCVVCGVWCVVCGVGGWVGVWVGVCVCGCVCVWCVEEVMCGGGGGGGARDTESKTRTPHKDVGKNTVHNLQCTWMPCKPLDSCKRCRSRL